MQALTDQGVIKRQLSELIDSHNNAFKEVIMGLQKCKNLHRCEISCGLYFSEKADYRIKWIIEPKTKGDISFKKVGV